MKNPYRSVHCCELTKQRIGETVLVAGWIDTIRDHGGVLFLDLRDHFGITQVVVHDDAMIKGFTRESVVSFEGKVVAREDENINPKLTTGDIEVHATSAKLLGGALPNLPFEIMDSTNVREEVRLKYRYLDLRNPAVHENIIFRSKVINFIRRKMEDLGFLEVTTPILTSSSPEGARDYIIPSRKFKGQFYALPQAPQQFKQLLMVSGFDKYFQIAPCFRDEDSRADRSPGEFYQLDFEISFATQEDVFAVGEAVMVDVFNTFGGGKPVSPAPFRRIPFDEAMLKYGSDKPDLRNPLLIEDLSEYFAEVDFAPFKGKPVRGIVVGNSDKMTRSFHEGMLAYATEIGMKGLGYLTLEEGGELKGPIAKFLTEEKQAELFKLTNLKANDTVFFISDAKSTVDKYAGQIRTALGDKMGLIDKDRYEFCYITDFPMFEKTDEGKIDFTHNPFSMPQGEMEALETMNPLDIKAHQYDIVCNGVELSSGAVRNHRPEVMVKAFEIAGYSEEIVKQRFGALYNAFQYGAPPHAGMAPGIDRILMLLKGETNIREVIAFPMNSNAQDLLMGAPGEVTEEQLREVHIKIRK